MKFIYHQDDACGCGHHHAEHNDCCCGHDHEEHQTITLFTEDDRELICEVVSIFDYDNADYIALLAEGQDNLFIYHYDEDDNHNPLLNRIENEELYQRVGNFFMTSIENEA